MLSRFQKFVANVTVLAIFGTIVGLVGILALDAKDALLGSTAYASPAVLAAPGGVPLLATAPGAVGFSGNVTQGGTKVSVTTSTAVLAASATRSAYCVKMKIANTQPVHCELGATATTDSMEYDAKEGWCDGGAQGVVYAGPISCISADGSAQNVFVWAY